MLDLLRPFFRGDWAQYGECLQLRGATAGQPSIAGWMADSAHLAAALARHAEFLGSTSQPKAVASDWMLRYLEALLPAMVALSSLLKYCIPAGWRDMTLKLNERGAPIAFVIGELGAVMPKAAAAARYDALVWQHLEPLVTLVSGQMHVPARILRGNVRRVLLGIFGRAIPLVAHDPDYAAGLLEDRRELLESPTWPDGRRNPLFLRHRQVCLPHTEYARSLTLHASCCLAYRLPRTGYCGACPLVPEKHRRSQSHGSHR